MLSRRMTQQLPPGESDIVKRRRTAFHKIGIKPEDVATLKRFVALNAEKSPGLPINDQSKTDDSSSSSPRSKNTHK